MSGQQQVAGYDTSGQGSMSGRPLGVALPADEFLHDHVAGSHYSLTETSYFGFSIPERNLNGEIYIWFHPVMKVIAASIYIWTGLKPSTLACEYVNHHHYLPYPDQIADYTIDALDLRISVNDPMKSVRIEFDDKPRGVALSLRLDAIMPPALRPDGCHFTQAMKTGGWLDLYGERMAIDGFFSRGRSWGQPRPETSQPIPPLTWMAGIVDEGFAFHAVAYDDPAMKPEWAASFPQVNSGNNMFWGYIWKDGALTPVIAARKLTTREPDGLAPRLIEMELDDAAGRTFPIRGYVQARMPWQTWQNMNTFFGLTRWETGGRVGYGDIQDVQFNDFTRTFAR